MRNFRSRVRTGLLVLALGAPLAGTPFAVAGEADDLQRMIDGSREGANDLERLDKQKAVREDLVLQRVWLEEAWRLRSEQKYDEVRIVLDRCDAQAEMIREKIGASTLLAEATAKEAQLAKVRKTIATTKEALRQAAIQKAALQSSK